MNNKGTLRKLIGVDFTSNVISLRGRQFHYIEAGSGFPIVLLHGLNIGVGQWYKNISVLLRHYRVIAIDFINSGSSQKVPYAKVNFNTDYTLAFQDFISYLDLQYFHLMGHSLGGWLAIKFVLLNPKSVSKLVLIDAMGFTKFVPLKMKPISIKVFASFISQVIQKVTFENINSFLASVMHDQSKVEFDLSRYYFESLQGNFVPHPLMLMNLLSEKGSIKKDFLLDRDFYKIIQKVLIVWGDHDKLFPLRKVKKNFELIKYSQAIVLPDSGHVPFIEQSKLFNDSIIGFLK